MHAPFFHKQGEIEAEVALNNGLGIEYGAGYALTSHVAVIANGNLKLIKTQDSNYSRNRFIESGIGYFDKIGKNGVFEIYAGAGWGKSDALAIDDYNGHYGESDQHLTETSGNYFRIFMQLELGLSFGGKSELKDNSFEIGIIYRPVYVSMLKYRKDDITITSGTDIITDGTPHAFLNEFGGFYRLMFKNLGLELQSGFSFPPGNIGFESGFFIASIGIIYRN